MEGTEGPNYRAPLLPGQNSKAFTTTEVCGPGSQQKISHGKGFGTS